MEQVKSKKKGIIIAGISAIVLIAVLGISFAVWNYSRTTDNQILVAGDIYMKFKENPALTIENAIPSEGPGENDYFEFTIEGKNTYSKPIWYEIDIQHGEPHDTRKTRIEDNLLVFKLVEVKDEGQEEVLIEKGSYTGLAAGKGIYVNTIPAGTNTKITKTYRLYMWISSETVIGNVDGADYDMETWSNDVFASIKVNVFGDFNEKELEKPLATEVVKGTIGQPGGVIGVTNDSESTKVNNSNIREYRYSGPSVNNYVYFNCKDMGNQTNDNCELWRVIGVFEDESGIEHIKIVKNDTLTGDYFPDTYTINETTYSIRGYNDDDSLGKVPTDKAYWDYISEGSSRNDWTTAGLQYYLNTSQDTTGQKGYLSYLNSGIEDMIEETTYYLGNFGYFSRFLGAALSVYLSDTTIEAYEHERGNIMCNISEGNTYSSKFGEGDDNCNIWLDNKPTWHGKVALLYMSDYGYSMAESEWSKNIVDENEGFSSILGQDAETSWMSNTFENSDEVWLLQPSSNDYGRVLTIGPVEKDRIYVGDCYLRTTNYVRPTLYLKNNVKIKSGDGSEQQPYQLSL